MKVPIKHAIDSAAWFQCHVERSGYMMLNGIWDYRLRVVSFIKVNLADVSEPDKINAEFDVRHGDFWFLKLEVVNLTKQPIDSGAIEVSTLVLDQDDYEYSKAYDSHLYYTSKFCETAGLNIFSGALYPKIQSTLAFAFFLPKDENAEYHLSVVGGNLREV